MRRFALPLAFALILALALFAPPPLAAEAKTRISLSGVKGTWYEDSHTVIWGKASVSKPTSRWVRVQRKKSGGSWKTVAYARVTSSKGAWNWSARIPTPTSKGSYSYRARVLSSRHGKVLKTSSTHKVTVKAQPRVHRSVQDGSQTTWWYLNYDRDAKYDALAQDATAPYGYYEDIWLDSDQDPNSPPTYRFNVHVWNTYAYEDLLEYMTIDVNYDGVADYWFYDTNQRVGFDGWAINAGGYWAHQVNTPVTAPQPLGVMRDFGVYTTHTGGYVESCGRTNCVGPGL